MENSQGHESRDKASQLIKDSFESKISKKSGKKQVLARKISIFRQGSMAVNYNKDSSSKIISSRHIDKKRLDKKMVSVSDMEPEKFRSVSPNMHVLGDDL